MEGWQRQEERKKKKKNGEDSERREGSIGSVNTVTLHGINVFLYVTISAKI